LLFAVFGVHGLVLGFKVNTFVIAHINNDRVERYGKVFALLKEFSGPDQTGLLILIHLGCAYEEEPLIANDTNKRLLRTSRV